MVREQTLVTLTVDEIRRKLPFSMLGLDLDNDSASSTRRLRWGRTKRPRVMLPKNLRTGRGDLPDVT